MIGDNIIMYLTETNHIPSNNAEINNIVGLKMNNVINIHYNIKVIYKEGRFIQVMNEYIHVV